MRILYQSILSRSWIRQRPHFLAEGLAGTGEEVFWFYTAVAGKCRFRRWKDGLELPAFPFASRSRAIVRLNRLWTGFWLRNQRPDVVVATNPVTWDWMPARLRARPTLYDCMDIHEQFYDGFRRERLHRVEAELVRASARITASSPAIAEHLRRRYGVGTDSVVLLPNAYSPEGFRNVVPREGLKSPAILYAGTMDAWFDWASVVAAAQAHPEWTFYLVGPCVKAPEDLPANIVMHGPVDHADLPSWLVAADVLLLPFVRTPLIDGVDPVKMYEYLAAGRPVVSSWWPVLEKYRGLPAVSFYDPAAKPLAQVLETSLRGPSEMPPPANLCENTWEARVGRLREVIALN